MSSCPRCAAPVADGDRFCPRCGASVPALPAGDADPMVGQLVGNAFRLVRAIGSGAVGAIYEAEQLSLNRRVVVKLLRPHLRGDAELSKLFYREAQAASLLNHPNCIRIADFGQTETGSMYIAMELVEGRNLRAVIANEFPLDTLRIVRIVRQIALALDEAHAGGVLHRDLKPENIMVGDRRNQRDLVKVLDFGIAKVQAADTDTIHSSGTVFGTPGYMSPEQIRSADSDGRSDLYSLGVILYELLTGRRPFLGASHVQVVSQHLSATPKPPSVHVPAVDPELERLCLALLAKSPDKRPRAALDVVSELDRIARRLTRDMSGTWLAPTAAPPPAAPRSADDDIGTEAMAGLRSAPVTTGATVTPAREAGRILIVEDNELNRDMLSRRLMRVGFAIEVASDGREGVRLAESTAPDLILMDMSLPVMDGWEATRTIKANPELRSIPIIALTAHALKGDREKAMAAGCDDFDTKPLVFSRLLEKISARLERAQRAGVVDTPTAASTRPSAPTTSEQHVLLVSSRAAEVAALVEILADVAHLSTARSGFEAIRTLDAGPVDLVVVDLEDPALGGQGVLAQIRSVESLRDVVVLALAGDDRSDLAARGVTLGADDLLTTPCRPALVRARVVAALDSARLRASLGSAGEDVRRDLFAGGVGVPREAASRHQGAAVLALSVDLPLPATEAESIDQVEALRRLEAELHGLAHRCGLTRFGSAGSRLWGVGLALPTLPSPALRVVEMAVAAVGAAGAAGVGWSARAGVELGAVVCTTSGDDEDHGEVLGSSMASAWALAAAAEPGEVRVSAAAWPGLEGRFQADGSELPAAPGGGELPSYRLHVGAAGRDRQGSE